MVAINKTLRNKAIAVFAAGAAMVSMTGTAFAQAAPAQAQAQELNNDVAQAQAQELTNQNVLGQDQAQAQELNNVIDNDQAQAQAMEQGQDQAQAQAQEQAQDQTQGQAQAQEATATANNNGNKQSMTYNEAKRPSVTFAAGAAIVVTPDNFFSRQSMVGTQCINGESYIITQGDSAFGRNSAEAIPVKMEYSAAARRRMRANGTYNEMRGAAAPCAVAVEAPNFPQPAPAPVPVAPVVNNTTIINEAPAAPVVAATRARRVVTARRPVRRPVRRTPSAPTCQCTPTAR